MVKEEQNVKKEERESSHEENKVERARTEKRHTTHFIKEVFDSCFDEYIHEHNISSEEKPSYTIAAELLGYADEVLAEERILSKKQLKGKVSHIFSMLEDYPHDEELKHASLAFAHKVKTVYGHDPKHLWINIFVKPTTMKTLEKGTSKGLMISLGLVVILVIALVVWLNGGEAEPERTIISKNIIVKENQSFIVDKTISETFELPISFEEYLEQARKVQGTKVNLTGYLTKEYVLHDDGLVGEWIRYIIDDEGRRIIVESIDDEDDALFPVDVQGDMLYRTEGYLKDRYVGLSIQSLGGLETGSQPTETRDKVIQVEEIREVNITKKIQVLVYLNETG